VDIPKEALLEEGFTEEMVAQGIKVFQPVLGHEDCPTGYKGRCGIYQVMPISDAMKRLIIEGANAVTLADQSANEGIWDIRRAGLQKVMNGITSLAEVNRVTVE
jgi:type IV pilus assembly protein PilB